MAKRKPEPTPANRMRTTERYMQRDREAFASNVAASIIDYKNAPKAFKADQEEKRTHIVGSLKLLWGEFDRIEREKTGEMINGAANKTEWAKAHKISMRYCQYIINGRKPRNGEHANRAVRLKLGMVVKIDDWKFPLTKKMIATLKGMIEEPKREEPPAPTETKVRTRNAVVRQKNGHGKKEPPAPEYKSQPAQVAAVLKDVMVRGAGDEPTAKAWGHPARKSDIGIHLPTKEDADVVSTTKVGDKTEPTPYGFYYEFVKDEKPYAVWDVNNPNLGILCKCKNKADAELKIATYEREAAEAMAAAAYGAVVPQVCKKDYTEEVVAQMFAKGGN